MVVHGEGLKYTLQVLGHNNQKKQLLPTQHNSLIFPSGRKVTFPVIDLKWSIIFECSAVLNTHTAWTSTGKEVDSSDEKLQKENTPLALIFPHHTCSCLFLCMHL